MKHLARLNLVTWLVIVVALVAILGAARLRAGTKHKPKRSAATARSSAR